MTAEARTMQYVRDRGYPVPAVEEISEDGTCLVLERIDGVSMVGAIAKRPWRVRYYGGLLADLHLGLHELQAPEYLPEAPASSGDRLLHLDLHPLNVLISPRGPVVIDWTNSSRGDPAVDVTIAWVLLRAGAVPDRGLKASVLGLGRSLLVNSFLARFDLEELKAALCDVVEWKVEDPNMSPAEQRAMWHMVEALPSP